MDNILVSSVLSIHNRSRLFKRALDGYLWQTLPPDNWEIVLVDDMSTENLRETYRHLIGKINLRHIYMDHTRSPIFKERNPNWKAGDAFENWFHTPALSNNLGFYFARGPVISLCHPEILHAPGNFVKAIEKLAANSKQNLFGRTYLGTQDHNRALDADPDWTRGGRGNWEEFINRMGGKVPSFGPTELYWYTSFLTRETCWQIRGVDFKYLGGVAGEDDDFKLRAEKQAGCIPVSAYDEIFGFHQDHADEKEQHRRRDNKVWEDALARNRALFYGRKDNDTWPQANPDVDWTAAECIVDIHDYTVGETAPVIMTGKIK